MKDYKVLLGWASILFAVGFVIRSVAIAYASPYGPNVSIGSNPIENIYGRVINGLGQQNVVTIWTNETEYDLIVTTALAWSSACEFLVNGTELAPITAFHTIYSGNSSTDYVASPFIRGTAKLKVTSGSTIDVKNPNSNSCDYYIEGYYVRP